MQTRRLGDGEAREFAAIGGVGAVRAEEKEPVEVGRHELRTGGAFHRSGHESEDHSRLDETREDLLRTGKNLVLLGGPYVVGKVQEVLGIDLVEFVDAWVSAEHTSEGLDRDLRIGFTGRGVLADVGRDAVQLLERGTPTPRTGPAGMDQRLVHIEQRHHRLRYHGAGPCSITMLTLQTYRSVAREDPWRSGCRPMCAGKSAAFHREPARTEGRPTRSSCSKPGWTVATSRSRNGSTQ